MSILLVKSHCPHCRKTLMPIGEINNNLNFKDKIDVVDCFESEMFGMKKVPMVEKFKFDGYPTLFINGVKIHGMLTSNQLKNFLDGFYEKDKIIPEEPDFVKKLNRQEND